MVVLLVLSGCKDPVCGADEALLDGECIPLLDPVGDDDTVYVEPDTSTDTGEGCGCVVCDDGTGEHTSIQEAIDAAADGDEITICSGTYREPLDLGDKSVSLTGEYGVRINASRDAPALIIAGGQGPEVVISGLIIQDGNADRSGPTSGYGGGIYIAASSPTITDCTIEDSTAIYGGGVALIDSTATLDGVTITGATAEEHGGGIYISGGDPWVVHSVVEGGYAGEAGGLYATMSTAMIHNTIFDGCTSSGTVSAVAAVDSGVELRNLVVAYATAGDDTDCALSADSGSTLYSTAAYGNEGIGLCSDGSTAYNLSYGNHKADFYLSGSYAPGEGDLSEDPQFVDPNTGDYTLRSTSPMIDAGHPDASYNDTDGSRNDMGAFGGPSGEW